MTKYKYSFKVFWSAEDNAYVAICPELPGVTALGDSEGEALREAKVAMELYVEDMLESGEALPEPQTARVFSGQTRLRISKTLHRLAAQRADEEGESLNQYFAGAIQMRVAGEQVGRCFLTEMRQVVAEQTRQNQIARELMEQRLIGQVAQHGIKQFVAYFDGIVAQPERLAAADFNDLWGHRRRPRAIGLEFERAGGSTLALSKERVS